MTTIRPRQFNDDLTAAVETWIGAAGGVHLAVHAITKFDVLAEVTVHWMTGNGLGGLTPAAFRRAQGRTTLIPGLPLDTITDPSGGRGSSPKVVGALPA